MDNIVCGRSSVNQIAQYLKALNPISNFRFKWRKIQLKQFSSDIHHINVIGGVRKGRGGGGGA